MKKLIILLLTLFSITAFSLGSVELSTGYKGTFEYDYNANEFGHKPSFPSILKLEYSPNGNFKWNYEMGYKFPIPLTQDTFRARTKFFFKTNELVSGLKLYTFQELILREVGDDAKDTGKFTTYLGLEYAVNKNVTLDARARYDSKWFIKPENAEASLAVKYSFDKGFFNTTFKFGNKFDAAKDYNFINEVLFETSYKHDILKYYPDLKLNYIVSRAKGTNTKSHEIKVITNPLNFDLNFSDKASFTTTNKIEYSHVLESKEHNVKLKLMPAKLVFKPVNGLTITAKNEIEFKTTKNLTNLIELTTEYSKVVDGATITPKLRTSIKSEKLLANEFDAIKIVDASATDKPSIAHRFEAEPSVKIVSTPQTGLTIALEAGVTIQHDFAHLSTGDLNTFRFVKPSITGSLVYKY